MQSRIDKPKQKAMKILDVPQSGSQSGTVSSRNRFGQYRRTRATPVNPNSPRQSAARLALLSASQAWQELTDLQRQGWTYYADAHPRTDSLGQTVVLTGHQMFVGFYSGATAAGLTLPTAAPGAEPSLAPGLVIASLTSAAFTLTMSPDPVPAASAIVVEASPPVSPGKNFNSDYRLIQVFAAAADVTPANIFMAYTAKFGGLVSGRKVFVRAKLCDANGPSGYVFTSGVVA